MKSCVARAAANWNDEVTGRNAIVARRTVLTGSYAIAVLWLLMSLTYPAGWDQGLFAWVGSAIVRGDMPYRDAWDFKGPLVYYVFALAEWLFGVNLWGIRVLDAALLLASTLAVHRAAVKLTDDATARWTSLVYLLWYASHSYWHTAQPDGWTGMLLVIALAPIISGHPRLRWPVMAFTGACIGVLTLFKPTGALFLAVPMAYVLIARPPRRAALSAVLAAGWLFPLVAIVSWFAFQTALGDLIDVHLRYAAVYASLGPENRLVGVVDYLLTGRVITVVVPLAAFGAIALWQTNRPVAVVLGAWAMLAIALVAVQNRFYAYHWLPMLPAVTLLAAIAIHQIRATMPALATVMVGVVLLHALAPIVFEEARFVAWLTGRMDTAAYYDAYGEPGNDMRAVRWLREHGEPGPVFVFGWHSAVAWLSGRETVSRFGYSLPLMLGEDLDMRARYRAEVVDALTATPPRYILVGAQSAQILGARVTLDDFPALADLIRGSYQEASRFGSLTIYARSR